MTHDLIISVLYIVGSVFAAYLSFLVGKRQGRREYQRRLREREEKEDPELAQFRARVHQIAKESFPELTSW